MSKLILGGDKFYKVEWDELLENAWGWSGTRSFKLGLREDFCWDLNDEGLSIEVSEEKAFRDRSSVFQGPEAGRNNVPVERSAGGVASWDPRRAWRARHWAVPYEALEKEFGCYSKDNKRSVKHF